MRICMNTPHQHYRLVMDEILAIYYLVYSIDLNIRRLDRLYGFRKLKFSNGKVIFVFRTLIAFDLTDFTVLNLL